MYKLPKSSWVLYLLLVISTNLSAIPLELDGNVGKYLTDKHLYLLEDPTHQLTFNDINTNPIGNQFKLSQLKVPNYGQSRSTHWAKISVKSVSDIHTQWLLAIEYALLDSVTFYTPTENGQYEKIVTGDKYPFSSRPFNHRYFIFPLKLTPGIEKTFYFSINSVSAVQLPVTIYSAEKFINNDQVISVLSGLYFGVAGIMCIYNLIIFFTIRDRSFLDYVLFTLSLAIINASLQGYSAQFLWPNNSWLTNVSSIIWIHIGILFGCFFAQSFLDTKKHTPILDKVISAYQCFTILSIFGVLLSTSEKFHYWTIKWVNICMLLYVLLSLIVGFRCLVKGVNEAKYYSAASVAFLVSLILFQISYTHLIPGMWVTIFSQQLGSVVQIVLLSLGLASRMKKLRIEAIQAQASAKAKGDFLAVMSHEIRTPMNGVLGMAQLLKENNPTPQQMSQIKTILSSGQVLMTVLNDILDFSKIDAGKISIECIDYDVRQLIDQTCAVFFSNALSKNIALKVYIDAEVPLFSKGDPNRIRQILSNLLSNAVKFTHEGEIVIHASVNSEKSKIIINIKDSGIGISSEKQHDLFQRFSQADHSTSREFGGTGLGLAIAKQLTELMGGNIGVDSKPNSGATFHFSIPIISTSIKKYMDSEEFCKKISREKFVFISSDEKLLKQMESYAQLWQSNYRTYKTIKSMKKSCSKEKLASHFIIIDQIQEHPSNKEIIETIQPPLVTQKTSIIIMSDFPSKNNFDKKLNVTPLLIDRPFKTSIILECIEEKIFKKQPPKKYIDQNYNTYEHKSVLIIDDNPVNLQVASALLENLHIKTTLLNSGIEAISVICEKQQQFDLILMDCEMPVKDGFETTAHIRQWEQNNNMGPTKIIALSAHTIGKQSEKCFDVGMDDFLAKPIVLHELKSVLNQYLI